MKTLILCDSFGMSHSNQLMWLIDNINCIVVDSSTNWAELISKANPNIILCTCGKSWGQLPIISLGSLAFKLQFNGRTQLEITEARISGSLTPLNLTICTNSNELKLNRSGIMTLVDLLISHSSIRRATQPAYICVKEEGRTRRVPIKEINFIKASGQYSIFHLDSNRRIVISKTLKHFTENLGEDFIRINRSYLVPKCAIQEYIGSDHQIILHSGITLQVSRRKADKVLQELEMYRFAI